MARKKVKKPAKTQKAKKPAARSLAMPLEKLPDLPQRAGLPAKDSIIGITSLPAAQMAGAAAGATKYRIIHTNETDEYEKAAASPTAFMAAAKAAPSGDNFAGTDRKAAKLSIANAPIENFGDVKDLIEKLPPEATMKAHQPKISEASTSNRVQEEEKNVHVKAFIYALSKESDNDFHLILGRDPKATPEVYMTMELSGLPPANAASFHTLQAVRNTFKQFYTAKVGNLPGPGYDFPDPPIPVEVEGSLFFDIKHASGTRPGPKSLKSRMPVIWEVHPITKMTFEG
ncbi:MAG TPA: hypothetical protein VJW20_12885 [Candidatus Angelobacter sp.]|nr:hypothetical protein [Candidatus Angelobacter sp.]